MMPWIQIIISDRIKCIKRWRWKGEKKEEKMNKITTLTLWFMIHLFELILHGRQENNTLKKTVDEQRDE